MLAVYKVPSEAGQVGVFGVGVGDGGKPHDENVLELEVAALFRTAPHTFCMGTPG